MQLEEAGRSQDKERFAKRILFDSDADKVEMLGDEARFEAVCQVFFRVIAQSTVIAAYARSCLPLHVSNAHARRSKVTCSEGRNPPSSNVEASCATVKTR